MNNTLEKLKAEREKLFARLEAEAWRCTNPSDRAWHEGRASGLVESINSIDTLIAEREKGVRLPSPAPGSYWDIPWMREYRTLTGCDLVAAKREHERLWPPVAPSQQQPASSLVEALDALKNPGHLDPIERQIYNEAIDHAIVAVEDRQHTREPDVEAGARALFESMNPNITWDEACNFDAGLDENITQTNLYRKHAQACIAAALKGGAK